MMTADKQVMYSGLPQEDWEKNTKPQSQFSGIKTPLTASKAKQHKRVTCCLLMISLLILAVLSALAFTLYTFPATHVVPINNNASVINGSLPGEGIAINAGHQDGGPNPTQSGQVTVPVSGKPNYNANTQSTLPHTTPTPNTTPKLPPLTQHTTKTTLPTTTTPISTAPIPTTPKPTTPKPTTPKPTTTPTTTEKLITTTTKKTTEKNIITTPILTTMSTAAPSLNATLLHVANSAANQTQVSENDFEQWISKLLSSPSLEALAISVGIIMIGLSLLIFAITCLITKTRRVKRRRQKYDKALRDIDKTEKIVLLTDDVSEDEYVKT